MNRSLEPLRPTRPASNPQRPARPAHVRMDVMQVVYGEYELRVTRGRPAEFNGWLTRRHEENLVGQIQSDVPRPLCLRVFV